MKKVAPRKENGILCQELKNCACSSVSLRSALNFSFSNSTLSCHRISCFCCWKWGVLYVVWLQALHQERYMEQKAIANKQWNITESTSNSSFLQSNDLQIWETTIFAIPNKHGDRKKLNQSAYKMEKCPGGRRHSFKIYSLNNSERAPSSNLYPLFKVIYTPPSKETFPG